MTDFGNRDGEFLNFDRSYISDLAFAWAQPMVIK